MGRKTANVVLNVAFGEPTIAVDTHIFRLGNRTGLAPGKTPLDVERKLLERDPRPPEAPRPSLAHSPRPSRLQGAQAPLPRLRRQRSVPLPGEDTGLKGPGSVELDGTDDDRPDIDAVAGAALTPAGRNGSRR